ncbi:hypothetical protein V8F06_005986 [Rhypophila decipiens]
MIASTITPILFGLAALSGTVLADTKNIHGGFVSMCAPETIKLCSSQADLAADKISLCASCYNDNTKTLNKNTASKLDLNHCLTNFNGQLSWRNNGSFARAGCSKCTSKLASPFVLNLQCECRGPDNTIVQPIETSVINLNEGVHVHNGQLVCFEEEGTQVFAPTLGRRERISAREYKPVRENPAFYPGPHNHTF